MIVKLCTIFALFSLVKPTLHECEPIAVPICSSGISYNTTKLPNNLGHETQEEAGLEVHQFWPLVELKCSVDLQLFLCSVYLPMCTPSGQTVRPCKSLCLSAKSGCLPVMQQYGFNWPDNLNCDNFPSEESSSCIHRSTSIPNATPNLSSTTPQTPMESETISASDQCDPITVPFCSSGISYNTTKLPNYLGHETQEEAGLEVHQFWPLVEIRCSVDLQLFLCSVYVPMCTPAGQTVRPCKSLCLSAKSGCSPVMQQFGFEWPDNLNCDTFPSEDSYPCNHRSTTVTRKAGPLRRRKNRKKTSPKKSTSKRPDTCEPVAAPFCSNIYNTTTFPNSLGHSNQNEAVLEIHRHFPIVIEGCSVELTSFLCAVYFPLCIPSVRPMPPCRSLCLSVKADCEPIMQTFGFDWPDNLNCDIFPLENSLESLCILPKHEINNTLKQISSTAIPDTTDQCEPITVSFCHGIPYNTTKLPNSLGYKSQQDVEYGLRKYETVDQTKCTDDLKLSLCSLYLPFCTPSGQTIPPCKTLCLSAKSGCGPLLRKYGFLWPDELNCDNFPMDDSSCFHRNYSTAIIEASPVEKGQDTTPLTNTTIEASGTCEPITVPFCTDISYNTAKLPNSLGHTSQEEAGLEIHQYFPLVKISCSVDLELFLCSVYFPICTASGRTIPPCKSLCLSSKSGCETIFQRFGFKWPDYLSCDNFPSEDSALCLYRNISTITVT